MSDSNPFGTVNDDVFSFDPSETGDDLPEAGQYRLRLVDLEKGVSKSGNPMWTATFTIVCNADGSPTTAAGTTLRYWLPLIASVMWKVGAFFRALGFPPGPVNAPLSEIVNRECLGEVVIEEYNGRDSAKIGKIESIN